MTRIDHMIDGWDAHVVLPDGSPMILHFGHEPSEAEIADAIAAYSQSEVGAGGPDVEVECEDGTVI